MTPAPAGVPPNGRRNGWRNGALLAAACLLARTGPAAETGAQAPMSPANHALIITVSEYQRSPLPGVLTDRKLANELARRFGVPPQNIVELSEQQVTREGLRQALANMNQIIMPGDKLYVYFSGHGARFFSKATGQCTESIVMQDMHVVTNAEFAAMLKPLSAKTDKTIVMLDSCHSGGVARAASSRVLGPAAQRPKFSAEASSPECALAVNLGSFSQARGLDLDTTDNNLVILAAARNNEVAWDTSKGGALTYNFEQCLGGAAKDSDHSGSLSMQELTACVQDRLDKTQEASALQHATLAGNAALVPAFGGPGAGPGNGNGAGSGTVSGSGVGTGFGTESGSGVGASSGATPGPGSAVGTGSGAAVGSGSGAVSGSAAGTGAVVGTGTGSGPAAAVDTLATLKDIYSGRDDRWGVQATVAQPTLRIGSNLSLTVRSQRRGFVYLFYQGTQPGSFYLLFPNQLDSNNAIAADQDLVLPRPEWSVTALGPRGTDHLLVMVTQTARDFSTFALPAEYVSQAGPFTKLQGSVAAAQHIGQIATLSAAAGTNACQAAGAARDLGVAKKCSNVFGASLISVDETD